MPTSPTSSLASFFATSAILAGCAGATAPTPVEPAVPATLPVHTFTSDAAGFDTHTHWIDTGESVVVFDAQFTEAHADQVIASVRAATRSPIRYLVITHPNPDKFNGAARFRAAGARVVASRATATAIPGVHAYKRAFFVDMAKMFRPDQYPGEAGVDLTFDDTLDLDAGAGVTIHLRRLRHAGVAATQTVAHIPAAHALIVGDLVHHHAHAWLEGGIVGGAPRPDLDAWQRALDELRDLPAETTVYGGRGDAALLAEAIAAETAYLRRASAIVDAYIAGVADRATLRDPATAPAHYVAIEEQLARAFPDYQLPYLIRYGVYGLVQARTAAR